MTPEELTTMGAEDLGDAVAASPGRCMVLDPSLGRMLTYIAELVRRAKVVETWGGLIPHLDRYLHADATVEDEILDGTRSGMAEVEALRAELAELRLALAAAKGTTP